MIAQTDSFGWSLPLWLSLTHKQHAISITTSSAIGWLQTTAEPTFAVGISMAHIFVSTEVFDDSISETSKHFRGQLIGKVERRFQQTNHKVLKFMILVIEHFL